MNVIKRGEGVKYVPPGHDEQVIAVKLFNPATGSPKVDAHITTFAPGCSMAEEVHEESDHIFYLIEGALEFRKAGELIGLLEPGDAIHIPAGEYHQVSNPGPGKGTIFAITVPPGN